MNYPPSLSLSSQFLSMKCTLNSNLKACFHKKGAEIGNQQLEGENQGDIYKKTTVDFAIYRTLEKE